MYTRHVSKLFVPAGTVDLQRYEEGDQLVPSSSEKELLNRYPDTSSIFAAVYTLSGFVRIEKCEDPIVTEVDEVGEEVVGGE